MSRYVTKTDVRRVGCPYCHALPGEKCIKAHGGLRDSNHTERIVEYRSRAGLTSRRERRPNAVPRPGGDAVSIEEAASVRVRTTGGNEVYAAPIEDDVRIGFSFSDGDVWQRISRADAVQLAHLLLAAASFGLLDAASFGQEQP